MTKNDFQRSVLAGAVGGMMIVVITGAALIHNVGGLADRLAGTRTTGVAVASGDVSVTALDVSDIVAKVNPAVVSIVISKDVPKLKTVYRNPFGGVFGNLPFNFGVPTQEQDGTETEHKEIGGGSGFLISADGYLVTNNHVVEDDTADYTVFTIDGSQYDAKVIAQDSDLDIALLKIEATDMSFLNFGDSDALRLGQAVIAIGNALGEFRNTVSTGVVSGLARSITAGDQSGQAEQLDNVIQTDAAINPGNSGGPLLDLRGNVVGVNVATSQGGENISFSLPASLIAPAIESMKATGHVVRAYLGVRYVPVTAALKEKNNLSVDYGALVLRGADDTELAVIPGSPADKAGIVENDIILEFDGQKIDEDHTLSSMIRAKGVGDVVSLNVLDKGTEKTVSVTLQEKPATP